MDAGGFASKQGASADIPDARLCRHAQSGGTRFDVLLRHKRRKALDIDRAPSCDVRQQKSKKRNAQFFQGGFDASA
jgi:hypothetical protein